MADAKPNLGSLFAGRAGKKKGGFKLKASKGVMASSKVQKLPTKEEEEVKKEVKEGGLKDISDLAKEEVTEREEFDRAALEREENARMLAKVREAAKAVKEDPRKKEKPAEESGGLSSLRSGASMGWREKMAMKEASRAPAMQGERMTYDFPTLAGDGGGPKTRDGPKWGEEAAAEIKAKADAAPRAAAAPVSALPPPLSAVGGTKKAAKSALDFDVDALGKKKKAVKVKDVTLPGAVAVAAPAPEPPAAAAAPAPAPEPVAAAAPAADRFAGMTKKKKKKKKATDE